jgi:hypothetical protein
MALLLLFVLLALLASAMLAYGIYLMLRIAGTWRKLRDLNLQRNYETLLYAALPHADVDEILGMLPRGASDRHLAAALKRMALSTEGEMLLKVLELQERLGPAKGRPGKGGRPGKRRPRGEG